MCTSDSFPLTPEQLINLSSHFAGEEGTALLFSGGDYFGSKSSFLCLFPYEWIQVKGTEVTLSTMQEEMKSFHSDNPWDVLKELVQPNETHDFPEWIGYFGYELGAFADHEKRIPFSRANTPDAYLQRCAVVLRLDHASQIATVRTQERFLTDKQKRWRDFLTHPPQPLSSASYKIISTETEKSYCEKITKAKELILDGEIYQVNLSQKFTFKGKSNPFDIFTKLSGLNPAPFSAFLQLKEFAVVSSSPERFLKLADQNLETRPIKGTAPRGKTPDEDQENRKALLSSEKEKAELLMITDLMRNDLGKVSLPGTVKTEKIWFCEAYQNVYHLCSSIKSKVKQNQHPIDLIRACFPGGSITGCPKLRSMEIIHELEQRPRGLYTGSIGYISGNGNFDLNIAIRTLVITPNEIDVQLGGAITADSNPKNEFEETLHKGASIFQSLMLLK